MKKRTKKILIIVAIIVILGIIASILLRPKKGPEIQTEKIYRGDLEKTVSEIGLVKPKKVVDLAFENSGIVESINFKVGDFVKRNDLLITLNAQGENLQVEQAQASLNLAKANLQMAQANDLDALEISYNQTIQAYQNTKQANQHALREAELTLEEAQNYTRDYQEYFDEISSEYEDDNVTKATRDLARATLTQIQGQEQKAKEALESLQVTSKQAEDTAWYTMKQARQALERQKALAYDWEKSNLLGQVDINRVSLDIAREALDKKSLQSPFAGIVSQIDLQKGEVAVAYTSVIQIISSDLQIEVNISETEIAKVALDQEVEISFDAIEDEVFVGIVVKIDPSETIIEGVTYYKVTIDFEDPHVEIKSGMSADLEIKIDRKVEALIAPMRAIKEKEGKKYVQVKEGEDLSEVEVVTGFRGDGGKIEIVEGLKEDDLVVTFIEEEE